MKYDRPVWQLMHACADAMPDTFGYADVRAWFDVNYPEVGEATLRAHIVGLTEGGAAKHPQFQRRSPLFRRVERGVYSPIPLEERGEDPDAPEDDEDIEVLPSPSVDRVQVEAEPLVGDVDYDDSLDDISDEVELPTPAPTEAAPTDESSGPADAESDDTPGEPLSGPTADDAAAERARVFGRLRRPRRDTAKERDDQVARRLGRPTPAEPSAPSDADLAAMYSGLPTARDFAEQSTPAEPDADPATEPTVEPATEPTPAPPAAPTPSPRPRDDLFGPPPTDDPRARYLAEIEAERARVRSQRDDALTQRDETLEQERRRIVAEETARIQAAADRALEAERAELAARLAEADQFRASHGEISRRAAEEIEAQRRQLVAEREEMAAMAAERAAARQAANEEIEAERARLAAQNEELQRAAAESAEARRAALKAMESERMRLAAEREQAAREEAQRHAAAEQAAIDQHRAESARLSQAREEAERHAAVQSEAARLAAQRAEEQRRAAAAAESERLELLRQEAGRAEAAVAQAEKLRRERVEAEQIAADEKRRARKLRKSAERSRAVAEQLEAEHQQRRAREDAEQKTRDEDARRRRDEATRLVAAETVRDDMNRLEREALARLEADRERAAMARLGQKADPRPPASGSQPTAAKPQEPAQPVVPAETESEQLAREELEHRETLRAARRQVPLSSQVPPGGAYIVRAPRPDDLPPAEPTPSPSRPTPPLEVPTSPEAPAEAPAASSDDAAPAPDAILLGSAGQRVAVPAPAKDSFRDLQFQLGRFDAELSGARWFVLSAELGLLEPDEWVSPEDEHDDVDDPTRRSAWASWVVARLESLIGDLDGKHVHVDAPDEYAAPLVEVLSTDGARVTSGVLPTGWARREAAADPAPERARPERLAPAPAPAQPEDAQPEVVEQAIEDDEPESPTVDDRPDAAVIPFSRVAAVSEHLGDADLAIPASAARGLPHQPGLYAWLVDAEGARDLAASLELPVRPGPLYVGQVGAGIDDVTSSLNDHVNLVELFGTGRSSAFRTDLATTLAEALGLTSIEDNRLTDWMLDHLTISVWPTDDVDRLQQVRSAVVADLRPTLAFDHPDAAAYRDRVAELRARLA